MPGDGEKRSEPTHDEMIALTIDSLRAHLRQHASRRTSQTWSATAVARAATRLETGTQHGSDDDQRSWELLPLALEAAWELVRRGILRPGSQRYPTVGNSDDSAFTLTRQGQKWMEDPEQDRILLLQPGALARTLAEYRRLYGDGYLQRANEAIKCRSAGAYLACCAMCGAAAESIVLALAIEKSGDEEAVLKTYNSRSGRSSVLNGLVGQVVDPIRRRLTTYSELLSYWRDDAAHGVASDLGDAHAEEALERLLRLAQFADDHWKELTGKPKPGP
jgi:hypothetical protein